MDHIYRCNSIYSQNMKIIKVLFFFLVLMVSTTANAQLQSENLFVEVDVSATGDDIVRYGKITFNDKNQPKRKYFKKKVKKAMFLDSIARHLELLPIEKRNTLVYIHGMWAYKWSFLKGNLHKMQSDMWANDANPNGMVVTVIWHCSVKYFDNREMAQKSGIILSPLIRDIHEITAAASPTSKTSYILHSMGNRVFKAMWEGHLYENMPYHAEHIAMAGADIKPNSFDEGEALENIGYLSDDVLVFKHNNDRTLGISKMLNDYDRLGLQGIPDLDKVSSAITEVDVSVITDNEDAAARFSNHRYFYMSPTVRKDLALFYQGVAKDKMPRRKELDHPRRYMLEMPENN